MIGKNHVPKSLWIGKAYEPGYYPFIWRQRPTLVKQPNGGIWVRDFSQKTALVRLKWLRRYKLQTRDL